MFDETKSYSHYTSFDIIEDLLQHGDIPKHCHPVPCDYPMLPIMLSCVMDSVRQLMKTGRLKPVKITVYNELADGESRNYKADTFNINTGVIQCPDSQHFSYSEAVSMYVSDDYSQISIYCIYDAMYSVDIMLEFDNTNMYKEVSD